MLLSEIQDFRNLELLARQVVEGFINGLHRSPFHGFSVEFAEHRPYNPGESVRYLDWKLYGRTDRLFVKRFQEETNLRCRLVLDVSGSMFTGEGKPKAKFSVLTAAAIMLMLRKQRDSFGLSLFADSILEETDIKSTSAHFDMLLNILQKQLNPAELQRGSEPAKILHDIADRQHRRSLIILFSDMFTSEDPELLFKSLQHLKHGQNEVIMFHVTDRKTELELRFDNKAYRFVDAESGAELKLEPAEYRAAYQEAMHKQVQELQTRCRQYKIDFIPVDAADDFRQVLLPFLMKRQSLY
jgi:uncharacterized protein (DUF58 family)